MKENKFRVWEVSILPNGNIRRRMLSNEDLLGWEVMPSPMLVYGFHDARLKKGEQWVWMQYTGLKDSYGAEEYYGDISEDDDGTRRVIEDGCSAVLFKDIKTGAINYFWQLTKPHKIIGNICENPELLERRTD